MPHLQVKLQGARGVEQHAARAFGQTRNTPAVAGEIPFIGEIETAVRRQALTDKGRDIIKVKPHPYADGDERGLGGLIGFEQKVVVPLLRLAGQSTGAAGCIVSQQHGLSHDEQP